MFGRRGPAQVKFTPLELRKLFHPKDVDIILYAEDFELDAGIGHGRSSSNNQTKTMVGTLTKLDRRTAQRLFPLHRVPPAAPCTPCTAPVEIYAKPQTAPTRPAASPGIKL